MCKFESSQKDVSRWQSTDSSKAYRNISAFKCFQNVTKQINFLFFNHRNLVLKLSEVVNYASEIMTFRFMISLMNHLEKMFLPFRPDITEYLSCLHFMNT